jgi:dUTP pyrophosphatase
MRVKKLHPDAKLPVRAEAGSNGYDLFASEDIFIPIGHTAVVPTGIAIEMYAPLLEGLMSVFKIEDRSSMAAKGLRTGGGVCDDSYRGEIKVVIHNLSADNRTKNEVFDFDVLHATLPPGYKIKKGDRIAQGLIYWTSTEDVYEVNELNETYRSAQGFGSTGQ